MSKIDEDDIKKLFSELKGKNRDIAFQKLYMKYNKLIYGIAFSVVKKKEDAEDVVQAFFAKLYTIKNEKLPSEKYTSWMYTVTKNEAIEVLRKKRDNFDIETVYEIEDEHNEINEIIDKIEFNKLINKLDNKEKEIVSLKILTNLSFEQISQLLNKPVGTVKWKYYKSMHTLKLLLTNLVMLIVTLTIGVRTLFSKKQISQIAKDENLQENENLQKNEANERLENSSEGEEQKKEFPDGENVNDQVQVEIDKTEENTVIEQIPENKVNYIGIGILSVSAIFLCIVIMFFSILLKKQLRARKRKSK